MYHHLTPRDHSYLIRENRDLNIINRALIERIEHLESKMGWFEEQLNRLTRACNLPPAPSPSSHSWGSPDPSGGTLTPPPPPLIDSPPAPNSVTGSVN